MLYKLSSLTVQPAAEIDPHTNTNSSSPYASHPVQIPRSTLYHHNRMASAEGMVGSSYNFLPETIDAWPTAMGSSAGDFGILHELNIVSENIDSPASSLADLPLLPTAPVASRKRRPDSSLSPLTAGVKRHCQPKAELTFASEPVTPPYSQQTRFSSADPMTRSYFPTSPPAQSLCSEEDDDCMPGKPAMTVTVAVESSIAFLPTPSKKQAAQRRALRLAHLKRSRTKKDSGIPAAGFTSTVTKNESELLQSIDQAPDKKAARAIRNRAAAMKSRVEAKQKMQKLELDNERLTKTVDDLTASNKRLASQIKALTSNLCPEPMTSQRQSEILALSAQFQTGESS